MRWNVGWRRILKVLDVHGGVFWVEGRVSLGWTLEWLVIDAVLSTSQLSIIDIDKAAPPLLLSLFDPASANHGTGSSICSTENPLKESNTPHETNKSFADCISVVDQAIVNPNLFMEPGPLRARIPAAPCTEVTFDIRNLVAEVGKSTFSASSK